ncbi:MAG: hypothetical protein JXQ75_21580 [Phycisphaerae bacterium]|nr:hypothetical protein [Phycisphaerae bacterium]
MSSVVIKAGEARMLSRGAYGFDLRDIAREAEGMLAAARAEAEGIVGQARRQAEAEREAVRQAAHRGGYEQGIAEGREAGRAAALVEVREQFAKDQGSLVSALKSLLDGFSGQREQLYLAARRDVVVLAIAIARRISKRLDVMDDVASGAAAAACQEALGLLAEATEAAVRAHPDDCQAVESLAGSLGGSLLSSRHIRVVRDATVGRGGVVVETADSTVDARVASRVDRIADELVTDWRDRLKALSIANDEQLIANSE